MIFSLNQIESSCKLSSYVLHLCEGSIKTDRLTKWLLEVVELVSDSLFVLSIVMPQDTSHLYFLIYLRLGNFMLCRLVLILIKSWVQNSYIWGFYLQKKMHVLLPHDCLHPGRHAVTGSRCFILSVRWWVFWTLKSFYLYLNIWRIAVTVLNLFIYFCADFTKTFNFSYTQS